MIETTIRNYLVTHSGVPVDVLFEAPKDPPASYIILEKTGSSLSNRLCTSTIAVQSIAGTLFEAATLNESLKSILTSADIENVFDISLDTDYNFTNTNTKEYRYQAVYQITYKE